jgi:hypothetical protein
LSTIRASCYLPRARNGSGTRNTWNIIRRADRPGRIGNYSAYARPNFSIPELATKLPSFFPPVAKGQQLVGTRFAGFGAGHRELVDGVEENAISLCLE